MLTHSSIRSSSSGALTKSRRPVPPSLLAAAFVSLSVLAASCASLGEAQTPVSIGLNETPTTTTDEPPSSTTTGVTQTEAPAPSDESVGTPSSAEITTPSADSVDSSTTTEVDTLGDGTNDLAAPGQRSEWKGFIDEDIGYTLWLAQDGDRVRGEITYDSVGTPITVAGRRYSESVDEYFLREFGPDGNVSGLMILTGVADGAIANANWGDLSMTAVSTGSSAYSFNETVRPGEFLYAFAPFLPDGAEPIASDDCCGPSGRLLLSDIEDDSIWVRIEAVTSGPAFNLAIIPPIELPLSGNRALYEETGPFDLDCAFEVVIYNDIVFVDYVDDRFDCQFGNGASVAGIYVLIE